MRPHIFMIGAFTLRQAKVKATRDGMRSFTWMADDGTLRHFAKSSRKWHEVDQQTLIDSIRA